MMCSESLFDMPGFQPNLVQTQFSLILICLLFQRENQDCLSTLVHSFIPKPCLAKYCLSLWGIKISILENI